MFLLRKYKKELARLKTEFSSPIFGDMFLLSQLKQPIKDANKFSSPIFGDMFLLKEVLDYEYRKIWFSSPIFGDMFLLRYEHNYFRQD